MFSIACAMAACFLFPALVPRLLWTAAVCTIPPLVMLSKPCCSLPTCFSLFSLVTVGTESVSEIAKGWCVCVWSAAAVLSADAEPELGWRLAMAFKRSTNSRTG